MENYKVIVKYIDGTEETFYTESGCGTYGEGRILMWHTEYGVKLIPYSAIKSVEERDLEAR